MLHFMIRTTKIWFIKSKKASQRLDIVLILYCSHSGKYNVTLQDVITSMDDKLVIPTLSQKPILHTLHSSHQGVANMTEHANVSVYWPGIKNSICTIEYNCKSCNEMTLKEPLILSLPPEWPFHQICADFFQISL